MIETGGIGGRTDETEVVIIDDRLGSEGVTGFVKTKVGIAGKPEQTKSDGENKN
jgi:hypothetical protein